MVCIINDCTATCILPNTVISQCEQNPCENGGTCRKHVLSYTCECLPGYNGSLCQLGEWEMKLVDHTVWDHSLTSSCKSAIDRTDEDLPTHNKQFQPIKIHKGWRG